MYQADRKKKRFVFDFWLVVVFSILAIRFFFLQIVQSEQYFLKSEKNRIREIIRQPVRGLIFDRHGKLLVDNYPAYSVFGIPYDLQNSDSVLLKLSSILKTPKEELHTTLWKKRTGMFQPVKLKRDIDFQILSELEERKLELPGIEYYVEPRRFYSSSVRAPHILGYLGEVSPDELSKLASENYVQGDIIGKSGLEKEYEAALRGEKGVYYIEVDALGRKIRTLSDRKTFAARPGNHLHLTIDSGLQRIVEQALGSRYGGCVVLNVESGEVLALASKPDYDPVFFTKPRLPEDWQRLASDPEHPFYHRMLQSVYPPGSAFKLVLALAAIQEKTVDLDWTVTCSGYKMVGRQAFDCWKKGVHGTVALLSAIEQSCNVYFYNLMQKVGLDIWSQYGQLLRFGELTGIDLPEENHGLLPDRSYLNEKYGVTAGGEGQMCSLAIGQGDVLVTPIQMAVFAMIIANEGTFYQPRIVKGIQDAVTLELTQKIPLYHKIPHISPNSFRYVKKGMYLAVHGKAGTARGLAMSFVSSAGKTGTAQNPHGNPHAWFIGFAPFEQPEIAFCVFIENGGAGSQVAVPIAKKILTYYFSNSLFGNLRQL